MGYRIVYEQEKAVKEKAFRAAQRNRWAVAVFLAVFLLGASFAWEEGRQKLCALLLPQNAAVTAVSHLSEELRRGEPAVDAIAAFCREVIYGETD